MASTYLSNCTRRHGAQEAIEVGQCGHFFTSSRDLFGAGIEALDSVQLASERVAGLTATDGSWGTLELMVVVSEGIHC